MLRACTPSCKSRSEASGQKLFFSHTHLPFTPELRLSEREIQFRQASAARFARTLQSKHTFRSEMCSTSRCYSSIYHEHSQRRGIPVSSTILRPLRNQEARRFTTRSSYFRLARGKGTDASVINSNLGTLAKPLTLLSHRRSEQANRRMTNASPFDGAEDRLWNSPVKNRATPDRKCLPSPRDQLSSQLHPAVDSGMKWYKS